MPKTINTRKACNEPGCDRTDTLEPWNGRCIEHSALAHMCKLPEGADSMVRFPEGLEPPEAHLYVSLLRRIDSDTGQAPAWVYNVLMKLIDRASGRDETVMTINDIFGAVDEQRVAQLK